MKILRVFSSQKSYFLKLEEYLDNGIYVLHKNLRTYILLGHKIDWFPYSKWTKKTILLFLFGRLFFSVWNKHHGKEFSAQAVYFSNNNELDNRDAKLFDFHRRKVRTICANQRRYDRYQNNRLYFEKFFPMVEMTFSNVGQLYFDERIEEKKEIQSIQWDVVFKKLFEIYQQYYLDKRNDRVCSSYRSSFLQNDDCMPSEGTEIVLFRQHGDLSADNVIVTNASEVFLIDFNYADYYPFFYDLFFLMFDLYVNKRNPIGFSLLNKGVFDPYFSNLCDGKTEKESIRLFFLLFAEYFLARCEKEGVGEDVKQKIVEVLHKELEII